MAKMFYTLDEAKTALGKSEEDIKQFAREGRLREFRDGPRLMFKADQVEQLRSEIAGGGDQVDLGVSDSGGMIDLVDTTGASGTSITLADTNTGQSTGFAMKGGTGSGIKVAKEDTALAADLGLSGTAGGIPSPARSSGSGIGSGGSRAGINVFGADEVPGVVDPMAQTAITPGAHEINLESVGSGSGLLDLSRERDDTSLGAVLEEISPGATPAVAAGDTGLAGAVDLEEPRGEIDRTAMVTVPVAAYDPMSPAFAGAALGGAIAAILGLVALISGMEGTSPSLMQWFSSRGPTQAWIVLAITAVVAIIFTVIGAMVGKMNRAAR